MMPKNGLVCVKEATKMSIIEQLEDKGYSFTGFYSHNREEAKQEALKLRKLGKNARIVLIAGNKYSRGGSSDGYSVYSKEASQ